MTFLLRYILVAMMTLTSAAVVAQPYAVPPPEGSDTQFVSADPSDDPDLDTYARDRIDIDVLVDRFVGRVDANGHLRDLDLLISEGRVDPYVTVQVYAGVDANPQKFDYVYMNDPDLTTPVGIMSKSG